MKNNLKGTIDETSNRVVTFMDLAWYLKLASAVGFIYIGLFCLGLLIGIFSAFK